MTATVVTPESGLVLEELMITPTLVAITCAVVEIMDGGISKQWDISLCSNRGHLKGSDNNGNHTLAMAYILVY